MQRELEGDLADVEKVTYFNGYYKWKVPQGPVYESAI